MKSLDCKRCSKKYEGDPTDARICQPCYKVLNQKAGWSDEDIMERYAPDPDEIPIDDDDEETTVREQPEDLAPPCHIAERLRDRGN